MPFCVPGAPVEEGGNGGEHNNLAIGSRQPDVPFVVPCRELCQVCLTSVSILLIFPLDL